MKPNKNTALLAFSMIIGMAFAHQACGQGYQGYQDPFQVTLNRMAQQQDQLARQIQGQQQAMIAQYRRSTNDYRTPDHIVLHQIDQADRQRNPAAYAAMERGHRIRMNGLKQHGRNATMMSETLSGINERNIQGYRNRSLMQDQGHRRYMDTVWERSNYVNPNTGDQFKLGWGELDQFQTAGGQDFYTGPSGRQFQHTGCGDWQELDEIGR